MPEKIEIYDWVQHTKFKVIGKVMDTAVIGELPRQVFMVLVSDRLPFQVWDIEDIKLHQKRKQSH